MLKQIKNITDAPCLSCKHFKKQIHNFKCEKFKLNLVILNNGKLAFDNGAQFFPIGKVKCKD